MTPWGVGAYAAAGRFPVVLFPFPGNIAVVRPGHPTLQPGASLEGQPLIPGRLQKADPTVEHPSSQRPADRTVRIADFTWVLPPDPGPVGPYPRMEFLIGAAISSAEGGKMTLAGIRQWIRGRYPSWLTLSDNTIKCVLTKRASFINNRTGKHGRTGEWMLNDPQQFGRSYKIGIMQGDPGFAAEDDTHTAPSLSAERANPETASIQPGVPLSGQPVCFGPGAETGHASELSVTIGDRIIKLPPCGAVFKRPSLRLLCGCALTLGPKQGMSSYEIALWIADHYPERSREKAIRELRHRVSSVLSAPDSGFRETKLRGWDKPANGKYLMKWVLEKPSDFAASYSESIYKRGLVPATARQ